MAFDEPLDWVDQTMASGEVWQPPPDFAARVVARATIVAPRSKTARFDLVGSVRFWFAHAVDMVRGYVDGSMWVLGQYRELFLRSG